MEVLHGKRLGLNYVQPTHIPAFTPMGFEKRRLPEDTFRWLRGWYDQVKEEGRITKIEGSAGPCMNQVDAPSVMHMITPALKTRMAEELKPILEDWYGHGKLKMTSIYGVRKYTDGSILRMHVDTANTHVISAIINVDQDVEEPWRLLILDHDENEHWLTMEPGDMVLYESAKMLHGRPEPMKGERYENIFLHYMPSDGWDYF
jgi:prolyl 4-hydroxylase